MYELLKLIEFADVKSREGKSLVLATIIQTIGSSYRKQGTQMIIADDLSYEGALSGGCVEKEVLRQSQSVFSSRENVVFEYDGRYKLGCNGRIYIVVEYVNQDTLQKLSERIREHHEVRKPFTLRIARAVAPDKAHIAYDFGGELIAISSREGELEGWTEEGVVIHPQFQLVVIGGEYDSTTLANMAADAGIRTFLIVKESLPHRLSPNVSAMYVLPEMLSTRIRFDAQTAIVIMTHSLSKDIGYLKELMKVPSCYLGVLGPDHRKKTVLNDLMSMDENAFFEYQDKLEDLRGPVGLNIGAVTPEEISVSILAEVIASMRMKHAEGIATQIQ